MSFLRLKSVICYCKRYTERIYVHAEDHWTMWGFLRRTSEYMIEDDSVLTYSQALDLATRVWAFAKWVAEKNNLADEAVLERMCLSGAHHKHFGDEEKWLVYEMGELAGYLDGRGEMQRDHLCSLLSLMTYTVADAIEREALSSSTQNECWRATARTTLTLTMMSLATRWAGTNWMTFCRTISG